MASDSFPVTWDDPSDAEHTWYFNPEHMPGAYTPLEFELSVKRFLEGFGWGMVPQQFNYYVYFRTGGPADAPPPPPTVQRVLDAGRRWREEVLPEVLALIEHYRATDFASLTNEQLAAEIERLPEVRFRSGQLHTMAVRPNWEGMQLLIDTFKELTGGGELDAMRMIQGYPNKSFESADRLWQVSRIAAAVPAVSHHLGAIEKDTALDLLSALREEPAATPFVEAFDAFLDEFGWRSNDTSASATWREDPTIPLLLLRSYLETEGYDPADERRRLIEERDAAIAGAMARLDNNGRARLQEAIDAALAVAPLLEDHNFFIDQRLATMPRRLINAAAARLPLSDPGDLFYLHAGELCAALRGAPGDLGGVAARRRRESEHWRTITPPRFLGKMPQEAAREPSQPIARDGTRGELRGMPASAGIARGPARVLGGLGEAARLRPGDILITSVTQPAWTPLFAVARAVVTEVGGMLSHTAVASREFGIPAVVAVRDATRLLRDGQLVEVDGSAGIVRIVG